MATLKRYLQPHVEADLKRRMVFVAGARQVGKTTLARAVTGAKAGYLNWDVPDDRERLLRYQMPPSLLWVLDEIHKYRGWRNLLKGFWDGRRAGQKILVTGSARLDLYRFGGESLQGRYHLLRLHPLSVAEVAARSSGDLQTLLELGGFPEPFLSGSARTARRWSRDYRTLLVRDEVTDLERVSDLGKLELLMLSLPERVGSPLSLNALREDLEVSHKTVARWVEILERLYVVFRLPPFGAPRLRAVRHEQKHYHLDWTVVPDPSRRFENLVACHLLKWVHFQQDVHGRNLELRYFRDVDRREVDFIVVDRRTPTLMAETKWGDEEPDRGLRYLHARFPSAEAWQISATGTKDYVTRDGIRVAPALGLLRRLV